MIIVFVWFLNPKCFVGLQLAGTKAQGSWLMPTQKESENRESIWDLFYPRLRIKIHAIIDGKKTISAEELTSLPMPLLFPGSWEGFPVQRPSWRYVHSAKLGDNRGRFTLPLLTINNSRVQSETYVSYWAGYYYPISYSSKTETSSHCCKAKFMSAWRHIGINFDCSSAVGITLVGCDWKKERLPWRTFFSHFDTNCQTLVFLGKKCWDR